MILKFIYRGGAEDKVVIEQLIIEREQARNAKNWTRADELRQQLMVMGVVLEDTAQGTIWRKV